MVLITVFPYLAVSAIDSTNDSAMKESLIAIIHIIKWIKMMKILFKNKIQFKYQDHSLVHHKITGEDQ
jgi:hypothetical protein